MTLLQVNQLQAWYGATQALFGVTFKLEQGWHNDHPRGKRRRKNNHLASRLSNRSNSR